MGGLPGVGGPLPWGALARAFQKSWRGEPCEQGRQPAGARKLRRWGTVRRGRRPPGDVGSQARGSSLGAEGLSGHAAARAPAPLCNTDGLTQTLTLRVSRTKKNKKPGQQATWEPGEAAGARGRGPGLGRRGRGLGAGAGAWGRGPGRGGGARAGPGEGFAPAALSLSTGCFRIGCGDRLRNTHSSQLKARGPVKP